MFWISSQSDKSEMLNKSFFFWNFCLLWDFHILLWVLQDIHTYYQELSSLMVGFW